MSSAIHGGGEFTNLPDAPSATENRGAQGHYCIAQHGTIVEEERKKDRGLGACRQKTFSEPRSLKRWKTPFWNMR